MLLRLHSATVDLDDGTVERSDGLSHLTPLELRLLRHLASRPGVVVPNEELLRDVWGYAPGVITRTITATTHRLRTKIEECAGAPTHVRTVWGVGLRLEPAGAEEPATATTDPALLSVVRRLEGVGATDLAVRVTAALGRDEPATHRAARRS